MCVCVRRCVCMLCVERGERERESILNESFSNAGRRFEINKHSVSCGLSKDPLALSIE